MCKLRKLELELENDSKNFIDDVQSPQVTSRWIDFSIGIVSVFCMLLKHCIWLNNQQYECSNTKDCPN